MASRPRGHLFTAKEIADAYQIPFELLAKVMQKLVKKGFISSYQGIHGGYILARDPAVITVSDVMSAIEEKSTLSIIQCEAGEAEHCIIQTTCTIRNPLMKLQTSINRVVNELTILEMV